MDLDLIIFKQLEPDLALEKPTEICKDKTYFSSVNVDLSNVIRNLNLGSGGI